MKLWKSWVIATKDFSIFRNKKSIIYSVVLLPLLFAIGLPLTIGLSGSDNGSVPPSILGPLLNSFSFFFVILAASITTVIASYSLIGEKVQKSIEPLLATPTTDGEILLGKCFAAFIPSIIAIYIGFIIFMILIDQMTYNTFGYLFFPNWDMIVMMFIVTPLASLLSVELGVILSARVNDVRTAQQLGQLIIIPFFGIYIFSQVGYITLHVNNLLIIAFTLLTIDLILFYISTITFNREEILTNWK